MSGELELSEHEEYVGVVEKVEPWGYTLRLRGEGRLAFLDQTKSPDWRNERVAVRVGDHLEVVVLDADRDPPRVSALPADIEIARRLRKTT